MLDFWTMKKKKDLVFRRGDPPVKNLGRVECCAISTRTSMQQDTLFYVKTDAVHLA